MQGLTRSPLAQAQELQEDNW
uniref:Uncharacterized protein n=1 Tax=Arundo donax TaxID=35708 RepID=A0A0A8ZPX4_ARUDO